ncbi:MAG: thiamine phosphate synthase [bacterium JZ-2024 1]
MKDRSRIRGVYLITDDRIAGKGEFFDIIQVALESGVSVLQYRDKGNEPHHRFKIASRLREMTRAFGVPLIINDFVYLAAQVGADGVHLGIKEAVIPLARKILGPDAWIGVSCHNSVEDAERMERAGVDYVAFGAIYRSPTKPEAPRASLETIRTAKSRINVPVVAIGGITPRNAEAVVMAGADAIAVISAVFSSPYPGRVVTRFTEIFQKHRQISVSPSLTTHAL